VVKFNHNKILGGDRNEKGKMVCSSFVGGF